MIKKIKNKIIYFIKILFYKEAEWKQIEYFDVSWKNRIQAMSSLIPKDIKSILDVGCGELWLKEFIEADIKYFGLDYKKRDDETIVCDLNIKEFPELRIDLVFCSGIVEYIEESNLEWFFNKLAKKSKILIISYCSLDLNQNINIRKSYGWKNHFNKNDFIKIILHSGFKIDKELNQIDGNNIFKFSKNN